MITREIIKQNPALVDAAIDFVCDLYGYAENKNLTGYIDNVIADFTLLLFNSDFEKDVVEGSHAALNILHCCARDLDAALCA